jgi:PhnB protein
MRLHPYLNFDGDCRAAFEFYARVLGGRIVAMSRFGDMPGCEHLGDASRERIMHARLEAHGHVLMGTDATPEYPYHGVVGAHVVLDVDDEDAAERLFAELAADGHVEMPLQPTFWARRYGIAVDRFGVPWMVNCALPVAAAQEASA